MTEAMQHDAATVDDELDGEWIEPDLDPEAHLLCAAMWSRDLVELRFVVGHVHEDDFSNPFHRPIFAAISAAVLAGTPHDPASIGAELTRSGRDRVPQAVHRTLRSVLTLGSSAGAARHYAANVVAVSYRRSFHDLARSMSHAAEAAAEDELFPLLVELGTRQRAESNRLAAIRRGPAPEHEEGPPATNAKR